MLGIGVLLCLVSGFLGAVISLFVTATTGVITTVVGLLLVQQRRPTGVAVATCGVALIVGVGAYILLGSFNPMAQERGPDDSGDRQATRGMR